MEALEGCWGMSILLPMSRDIVRVFPLLLKYAYRCRLLE